MTPIRTRQPVPRSPACGMLEAGAALYMAPSHPIMGSAEGQGPLVVVPSHWPSGVCVVRNNARKRLRRARGRALSQGQSSNQPRHGVRVSLMQRYFGRRPPIFYGWWNVLISSVLHFLTGGLYSLGLAVYFLPISRDLGLSRSCALPGLHPAEPGVGPGRSPDRVSGGPAGAARHDPRWRRSGGPRLHSTGLHPQLPHLSPGVPGCARYRLFRRIFPSRSWPCSTSGSPAGAPWPSRWASSARTSAG